MINVRYSGLRLFRPPICVLFDVGVVLFCKLKYGRAISPRWNLNGMAKKVLSKKDLLREIEAKVQALNLLYSAIKADRSRKPETLEAYRDSYLACLKEV